MTQAAEIAETLGKCSRGALLVAPVGPPGWEWMQLIDACPRLSNGRRPSFYQALLPLEQRGLLHREIHPRRENGTRPFDRFWLTDLGSRVRDEIAATAA